MNTSVTYGAALIHVHDGWWMSLPLIDRRVDLRRHAIAFSWIYSMPACATMALRNTLSEGTSVRAMYALFAVPIPFIK